MPLPQKATLNPALRDFWMTPARNRVLYGGRSSSKSWDAAGFAIALSCECKIKVLCTRQFQNKITDSVYSLLKIQIERFGLSDQFDIQNNVIRNKRTGSEFVFYGLWRHIEEIKSFEGADICWIEEAHGLTKAQWEILEPTIRKEGSQFWIVFNPKFATDFVYKKFVVKSPPNTVKRLINYPENPFLSQTMLDVIQAAMDEDYDDYQHVYLGVPRENSEGVIIKRSWLMASIDAHKTIEPIGGSWSGPKTIGNDVADDGDDLNSNVGMDGSICTFLDQWQADEDELFESTERTLRNAKLIGATKIGYDSIGVGAGVGSNLNQLKWRDHFKFNAGSKVVKPKAKYGDTKIPNDEFFSNLKAQAWWLVAERLKNTYLAKTKGRQFKADQMISLSSECDAKLLEILIEELSTPKKDYDNTGRVKVESKKDLKKRDVVSPNLGDGFIIANARGMLAIRSLKEML